ncbi:succinate dehydrogenase assembly factor 2 [Microvirga sp. W0021]|uniref:FAD assembly factor SdhE n=1 Tax=Hohaiivirga grylli TaxID=3133970 RepID=A0ABV0BIS0_9HYPH
MTGTTRNSSELDPRRRRILFRSWRRGTREMDLIMGGFADENLPGMSEAELDEFERIVEVLDIDLYKWINGEAPLPDEYDTPLMHRLISFEAHKLF